MQSAAARESVLERSILSGCRVGKTVISLRARVSETFSRRSPPWRFRGPKCIDTFPWRSGPQVIENRMTVAFVALHRLDVLDEDRLGDFRAEGPFDRRVPAALAVEQVFDQPLLRAVDGDHADAPRAELLVLVGEPPHDLGGDGLRLALVVAASASSVGTRRSSDSPVTVSVKARPPGTMGRARGGFAVQGRSSRPPLPPARGLRI